MSSRKVAGCLCLGVAVWVFAGFEGNVRQWQVHFSKRRLSASDVQQEKMPAADSFEAARAGSCCTSVASTVVTWTDFAVSGGQANISSGLPVVVPCGVELLINENMVGLLGLHVHGSVTFQDGVDVLVETDHVFVCGRFSIGSPSQSHKSKVEIVLTGTEDVVVMGKNFGKAPFATYGGSLYMKGSSCGSPAFGRLAQNIGPLAGEDGEGDDSPIEETNIALGMPAHQSSLGHHRYTAEKGVDGSFNWKYGSILTSSESNPWWYVEIASMPSTGVGTVKLIGRRAGAMNVDPRKVVVGVSDAPCVVGEVCGDIDTHCEHVLSNAITHTFRCNGARGSILYVQMEGEDEKLQFAEVEVFPSPTRLLAERSAFNDASPNIARGKPAQQSSTGHWRYTAGKGVDGSFNWKSGTILTQRETNPWWYVRIDTMASTGAGLVKLTERSRRRNADLSQAVVGITSTPCVQGKLCGGAICEHVSSSGITESFQCDGALGSILYVQLQGSGTLDMAEAEVYAPPEPATDAPVSSSATTGAPPSASSAVTSAAPPASTSGVPPASTSVVPPASTSGAPPDSTRGYELPLRSGAPWGWQVGDRLMITPTGFSAGEVDEVTVTDVSAGRVRVRGGLEYLHEGCNSNGCVIAAEVASLSRNIVIRGAAHCSPVCGHFMLAHTNHGFVCGVEFTNLGQTGVEGRYPLHIHMPGESPELIVKSNAVHNNINRGVVMHGVHNMTVESNLCYKTLGHCFMTEDGVEQHNLIVGNIGVHVSPLSFGCSASHDTTFTCPHRSDNAPMAFWISNPNNRWLRNVGVSSAGAFFVETRHVTGLTRRQFTSEAMKVGSRGRLKFTSPLGQFIDNVAHSSTHGLGNYPRMAFTNDGVYERFTAWRCQNGMGAHTGTKPVRFSQALLVENKAAVRAGLPASRLIISETKMIGGDWEFTHGGRHYVSAPLIINKFGKTVARAFPAVFQMDTFTKNWVRCHGGYDAPALGRLGGWFDMFSSSPGPCPTV